MASADDAFKKAVMATADDSDGPTADDAKFAAYIESQEDAGHAPDFAASSESQEESNDDTDGLQALIQQYEEEHGKSPEFSLGSISKGGGKNMWNTLCSYRQLEREETAKLAEIFQTTETWREKRQILEERRQRNVSDDDFASVIGLTGGGFELRDRLSKGVLAKQILITHNVRLVSWCARKYKSTVTHDDLMQEGLIGLTKAAEKFDGSLGYKFSTYAVWWIRQKMVKAITDKSRTVRIPRQVSSLAIRYHKVKSELSQGDGKPMEADIAEQMSTTVDKVKQIVVNQQHTRTVSFEAPSGTSKDGDKFGSLGNMIGVKDEQQSEEMESRLFEDNFDDLLDTALLDGEREVLHMRSEGSSWKKIGEALNLTIVNAQLLEEQAMEKLEAAADGYGSLLEFEETNAWR
jgi:RNA polymerase sigma factor (sigma-70 family)